MSILQYTEGGSSEPRMIASTLRTTSEEIALTVGLGMHVLHRRTRIQSDRAQRWLLTLVEVLNNVAPRSGSPIMAKKFATSRCLCWPQQHQTRALLMKLGSRDRKRCDRSLNCLVSMTFRLGRLAFGRLRSHR